VISVRDYFLERDNVSYVSVTSQTSERGSFLIARLGDYWQLSKPRIAAMAMFAVAMGFVVGSQGNISLPNLLSACFGIACVAVSCSFLNQWYEQDVDAQMVRTAGRPVPDGRIKPGEVLFFGLVTASIGTTWLYFCVNLMSAVLAAITLALYVAAYTPLKRVTCLCTVIGAVSGAMPPVLGWVAAGGALDSGAAALFLLLFVWQFPHFLAIATIYRKDYESAGLRMLPMLGEKNMGGIVGLTYAVALIPISLLVWDAGVAGGFYATVAVFGGIVYLISTLRFMLQQSILRARELVLCSIVYLPTVLITMTWDHFRLLR
jgi:heme o synthase